jgi:hypothetical protein
MLWRAVLVLAGAAAGQELIIGSERLDPAISEEVVAELGGSAKLVCRVEGGNENTIIWRKIGDNRILSSGNRRAAMGRGQRKH